MRLFGGAPRKPARFEVEKFQTSLMASLGRKGTAERNTVRTLMTEDTLPPPGSPDIEIARAASMKPIMPLADKRLGVPGEALVPYGHYKRSCRLITSAQLRIAPKASLFLSPRLRRRRRVRAKQPLVSGLMTGSTRSALSQWCACVNRRWVHALA